MSRDDGSTNKMTDAHDYMVAALDRVAKGEIAEGEILLNRALSLDSANPAVLTGLAVLRRAQGRMRDAVLACDAAIRAMPSYPDAWLERGAILAAGGSNQAARSSFQTAADLAPAMAPAHAGLAALAAREGDARAARFHAKAALQLDSANTVALSALAAAELHEGNPAAALEILVPLGTSLSEPSLDRILVRSLLGDSLAKIGSHSQAFEAYTASKADFAAINSSAASGQLSHREFVEAIQAGFEAIPSDAWTAPSRRQPDTAPPRHVFLIGYPRSGTTLLENVLASLPGVAALEERPTLGDADRTYLMGDRSQVIAGLQAFSRLGSKGIEDLRAAYWNKVFASGVPAQTECFVDMDPLKGTRLPLIARLFPDARLIIMRRDPRDVIWSCFRTNFSMSSGTLEYTSLDRAARHYVAMMQLTLAALDRLPLAVLKVHYHNLVRDFDPTTRAICEHLGLHWSPELRNFDKTAAKRGVATASAAQVRQGLYDGTEQWRPYAAHFEPLMPILAPWIERFGYQV